MSKKKSNKRSKASKHRSKIFKARVALVQELMKYGMSMDTAIGAAVKTLKG